MIVETVLAEDAEKPDVVLGLDVVGGNLEAPTHQSEKVYIEAEKEVEEEVPEKTFENGKEVENETEKEAPAKEMPSALIAYEKGFLHVKEVVDDLEYSDVRSLGDSFDDILVSPTHQSKIEKKKRLRCYYVDEYGENEGSGDEEDVASKSSTREVMKRITKRIKLLEDEIKLMSDTQLKMKAEMEKLIKKYVKKASQPILKAIEKLT